MRLSRTQRQNLLAGNYAPLTFTVKPDCEKGTVYVLSRSREQRVPVDDPDERKVEVLPSEPTLWIVVTTVTRLVEGPEAKWRWTVRFVVHDRRSHELFMHKDSSKGYTTDSRFAMRGERPTPVDDKTMQRWVVETRERNREQQVRMAAQRESEVLRRQLEKLRARPVARRIDPSIIRKRESRAKLAEKRLRALEDEEAA